MTSAPRSCVRFLSLLSLGCLAISGFISPAGEALAFRTQQPITLVGYFYAAPGSDSRVLRVIELSTDGRSRRPFGIVKAQSRVGTASVDVFRTSLRPIVVLRGRADMLDELYAAGPTQRVRLNGVLDLRINAITVTGVEVAEPTDAAEPAPEAS